MKTHALFSALLLLFLVACERDNFDNSESQIIEGDPEQIAHVPILGRVTNFSDEPLPNAQINLYLDGSLETTTTSNADGTFSIDGTPFEGRELLIEVTEENHVPRLIRIDNLEADGETLNVGMLVSVDGLEFQRSLNNNFVLVSGIALMENGEGAEPYVIQVTSKTFVDIESYFSDFAYPDSTGYYEIMVPVQEDLVLRVLTNPVLCVDRRPNSNTVNIPPLNEDFEVRNINGLIVPDDLFIELNTCSDNISLTMLALREIIRDTFGSGSLKVSGSGTQIFDVNRTRGFEVCPGEEVIIYAYDNAANKRSKPLNIRDLQSQGQTFVLDVCEDDETFFQLNSEDATISVDNLTMVNSSLTNIISVQAAERFIFITYQPHIPNLNMFYNSRFGDVDFEIISQDEEFIEISYSGELVENDGSNPLFVSGAFKALKLRQE